MELSNTFTVNLPVDDTWKVLTDLERVAPCMPGAVLLGVDGDAYRGAVKIKVGPVSARYEGLARFLEKDDHAHRAVIRAEGKDVGGQGNAAATLTATLTEQGEGTRVDLHTDLELSGRVAQFGRGVVADVSNKLLGQLVQRLESEFASGGATTKVPSSNAAALDDVEPLDVMSSMGATIAKRALPAVAVLLAATIAVLVGRMHGGRGSSRQAPIVINLSFPGMPGRSVAEEVIR